MQKILYLILATAMMLSIVSCSKEESNPVEPEIKPTMLSISKNIVYIGDLITIYGKNFGEERDSSIVSFGGAYAVDYTSWSDILIKVKVPEGAKSGKLFVKVGEQKSNEFKITINPSTTPNNDMILIPSGTFQMGNPVGSGASWEKPIHTVTISRAFYMSKYEVTQSQYRAVVGANASYFRRENFPVEQVTWNAAVGFCNALSLLEGKTPCYTGNGTNVTCNFEANGYRLPTEAEWEYAAKAGTSTDFYNGRLTNPCITPIDVNLDLIGWYGGNSNNTTHPVGQKQPNAFGFYDMSGNVWEWCWDWYDAYSSPAVTDPTGPLSGSYRVIRGGSWDIDAYYCRSAYRSNITPDYCNLNIGFRIVRVDK